MILYRWKSTLSDSTIPANGEDEEFDQTDQVKQLDGNNPSVHPGTGVRRRKELSRTRLKHAALDFLSNISLESEKVQNEAVDVDNKSESGQLVESSETLRGALPDPSSVDKSIGIRLRGETDYVFVCQKTNNIEEGELVPAMSSTNVTNELASRMRNDAKEEWENKLINKGVHTNARLFMSWSKAYPGLVTSVIKYEGDEDSTKRKTLRLSSVVLDLPHRKQDPPVILPGAKWVQRRWGTSYARYINQDWAVLSGDLPWSPSEDLWDTNYKPDVFHDPRIQQGRNGIMKALPGYTFSVLKYTRNKELKNELNEVFREQHPELPQRLTLSKIRNLKHEALQHAKHVNIDLTTVALAIVYFEKLVFKGIVNKPNRKLIMSACVVLAFKFHEQSENNNVQLTSLLQDIREIQSLAPKQVLKAEFSVLAHLNFHLNIPSHEWFPHLNRLLKAVERTPLEYFGATNAQLYFETAMELEESSSSISSKTPSTSSSSNSSNQGEAVAD